MPRASLVLCLLLAGSSLVGFGCKERVDYSAVIPGGVRTPPPPPPAPYVRRQLREEGPSPDLVFLRQTLKNLEKTRTYRLRIELPGHTEQGRGELLFSRERGVHASLSTSNVTAEIYLNPYESFVRYSGQAWERLISEEASGLRERIFRTFGFNQESGESLLTLSDSMKITSITDDPAGCKLYALERTYYTPEKQTQRLSICVDGSYPVRISSQGEDETAILRYDRFDDATILATSPVQ